MSEMQVKLMQMKRAYEVGYEIRGLYDAGWF